MKPEHPQKIPNGKACEQVSHPDISGRDMWVCYGDITVPTNERGVCGLLQLNAEDGDITTFPGERRLSRHCLGSRVTFTSRMLPSPAPSPSKQSGNQLTGLKKSELVQVQSISLLSNSKIPPCACKSG